MIIDSDGWLDQAVRAHSPHRGGQITPLVVVNHWTAGFAASGSVAALEAQGLSAHFVIGRDGTVIQTVSCNRRAYHAGASEWRGRAGVNGFSIGIEWCNLGPVRKGPAGWEAYGKPVPNPVFVDQDGQAWERLSDAQVDVGHRLHKALADCYPSIVEAVDHNAVAPRRKIDMVPWKAQVAEWGKVFTGKSIPKTPAPQAEREGYHVRDIQAALNRAGFHLAVDGIIGTKTLSAIIAFQKQSGLLHVGVINDETAEALGLKGD